MKIPIHPLENNTASRAYFESLRSRPSGSPVAAWREIVETLTGGLPSWAARERAGRKSTKARPLTSWFVSDVAQHAIAD